LATTHKALKTQAEKGGVIHHVKASPFALEKNVKKLAFFPSCAATFVLTCPF